MVLGYFGKTPVQPDAEVIELAKDQLGLEPTTRPVLELNDADPTKGIAPATKALQDAGLPVTDENIFIAAACKEKGIRFLQGDAEVGVRKKETTTAPVASANNGSTSKYNVTVNNKKFFMAVENDVVTVDGKVYRVGITPSDDDGPASSQPQTSGQTTDVVAQMPGAVYKQILHPGDTVKEGAPILILEAMKMEMEVPSPVDGIVDAINVSVGSQVATGDVLATVRV